MNKEKNAKGKILFAIIAIMSIVIIGLVIYIFLGTKDKKTDETGNDNTPASELTTQLDNNTEDNEQKDNEDTDDTQTDITETDKPEETSESEESDISDDKADCYVTILSNNSWEANGSFAGQLDAKIINKSSSEIKNWSIELDLTDGAKLDSSWNGNYEENDGRLTITPVEYNGTVPASGELTDIGFILNVASKGDLQTIAESSRLLVNGKVYEAVENADNDSKTEEETEQSTAEPEDKGNTEEKDNTEETDNTDDKNTDAEGTPFDNHGKLSVSGTDLVDKNGNKFQLKGVSTHGMAWFPDYVNEDAFKTFRDDWGANIIRLALYTDEYNGYCSGGDQTYLKNLLDRGVNAATNLGMYVIVDWHVLRECNPQVYKEDAKVFFEEMSKKYADYDNVIYEICNEPNGGATWSDVKSYAEEIIPIVRANAPDAIIIIGTPNWSQDVDIASNDPVTGYDNLMYAIHFYAATHTDGIRSKAETAIANGLPIFVSEFSICDASGNGAIDYNQADKWFELIGKYNLSYCGWNVSNKDETSSLIKPSCNKVSGWVDDDLSDTGIWLKNQIKGKK